MVQTRHHRGRAREAYDLAVIDRWVTRNPAPIHPGFLDLFVTRILSGRQASRKRRARQPVPGICRRRALRPRQTSSGWLGPPESLTRRRPGRRESAMVKAEYEAWQERRRK